MSKPTILKEVKTSPKTEIRLTHDYWNNAEWVSLRIWTFSKGDWQPTKRGITLKVDIAKKFFRKPLLKVIEDIKKDLEE